MKAESETQDISVIVETSYHDHESQPEAGSYVFTYRITIENQGEHTIKLLRRYWHITDSNTLKQEVEGEGVVGRQPVLEPGEQHQYTSGCNLQTDIGKMEGFFTMEKVGSGEQFYVYTPAFQMIDPSRYN
jgi:ApaG protein